MSTAAYEHILQELEHLTSEERRRLRQVLDEEAPAEPSAPAPDDRRARAAALAERVVAYPLRRLKFHVLTA